MYLMVQVREIGLFFPCPNNLTRKNVPGTHYELIVIYLVNEQFSHF
jgi:hypothetical protein